MRKNFIKKSGIIYVSALLTISGCAKTDNTETVTSIQVKETVADNTTVATSTAEETTTVMETTTEEETTTAMETTIVEETTENDPLWEAAKVSGSQEDFEKYFNKDLTEWTKKCENAGNVEEITYYSSVLSADRQAYVYLPGGYDKSKTYPVIYLIHGIGCDGGQWVGMGVQKMFDNMIDQGLLEPFIAVFPSVIPVEGIDKNTLSETNINAFKVFVQEYDQDLSPYLVENYNISTEREKTAICGLSMGGMEALRVGFTYLDRFNYIGSFSAAPTLETELLKTDEYVPALVLLCSGDKDNTVGENPYNYHKQLEKNGVDHIWYYHPGQSHSGTVWKLGLFNFLMQLSNTGF